MFRKITIYKAPVYRVFAEGVKLNNKGILIPDIKDETISEEELFYLQYGSFVNLSRDYVLLDRDNALDHIDEALVNGRNMIMNLMNAGKGPQGEKDFKRYLENISSFEYFNESEIQKKETISKKEFKELIKSFKEKN